MGLKLGLDKTIHWGREFGFGLPTTIDLPNESSGNYPLRPDLMKRYKGYIPKGILLNYGIGQGEVLATPMQMALYVSTIANKGYMVKPHLVRSIYNNILNRKENFSYDSARVPVETKYFDIVHEGMYRVVNVQGGTARGARLDDVEVCGKTGTAQNPHGQDHSWFICFAPRRNPRIAMAVMVENAGFGSTVAAPIAKKIMDSFFHPDSIFKLILFLFVFKFINRKKKIKISY
jgi:penicillin-binding protein 2